MDWATKNLHAIERRIWANHFPDQRVFSSKQKWKHADVGVNSSLAINIDHYLSLQEHKMFC